jgi:hypothetical protein
LSRRCLPTTKETQTLARIRPSWLWFACDARPIFKGTLDPGSMSGSAPGPPSAQGPFARFGRYPSRRSLMGCVSGHYPAFIAHTDPCAEPNPSRRLRSLPWSASLRRLSPVPAGRWPFPTLSLQIFPWMPGPLPRRVVEVHIPVSSLDDVGLPRMPTGSAFPQYPLKRLPKRACFRSCSHSLMFRPPSLLATPIAPTAAVLSLQGSRGVFVRAEHVLLPDTCIE